MREMLNAPCTLLSFLILFSLVIWKWIFFFQPHQLIQDNLAGWTQLNTAALPEGNINAIFERNEILKHVHALIYVFVTVSRIERVCAHESLLNDCLLRTLLSTTIININQ